MHVSFPGLRIVWLFRPGCTVCTELGRPCSLSAVPFLGTRCHVKQCIFSPRTSLVQVLQLPAVALRRLGCFGRAALSRFIRNVFFFCRAVVFTSPRWGVLFLVLSSVAPSVRCARLGHYLSACDRATVPDQAMTFASRRLVSSLGTHCQPFSGHAVQCILVIAPLRWFVLVACQASHVRYASLVYTEHPR